MTTDALSLLATGRIGEAEALARAALARCPADAGALHALGLAALVRGRPEDALAFLRRAVEAAPGAGDYRLNLALALARSGRRDEALIETDAALAAGLAEPWRGHFNRGTILYDLNRDDQAARAFRQALALNPAHAGASLNLANALRNLGVGRSDAEALGEAIGLYRALAAREGAPAGLPIALARALKERARLHLDAGRDAAACADADAAREAGEGRARTRIVDLAPSRFSAAGPVDPIAIDRATILPGDKEWFVLAGDGPLHLADMANGNPEVGHYVPVVGRKGRAILSPPERVIDLGPGPFVLLGGSTNYYHWMTDYLPRLEGLMPERAPWAGLSYLVNDDLAPFQVETLARAGLDGGRLLRLPAAPIGARCGRLFASPIGAVRQQLRPSALAWLRHLFKPPARGTGVPPARRVYISRRDAGLRRVVNETEITSHLKALGFRILAPGGMSVARQAQALSRAEIIVGPHGAGLTNMIFAPPGALVIETSAGSRRHLGFMESLAACCGHRYARLPCAARPSPAQKAGANDEDHDMLVPPAALAALIARHGKA